MLSTGDVGWSGFGKGAVIGGFFGGVAGTVRVPASSYDTAGGLLGYGQSFAVGAISFGLGDMAAQGTAMGLGWQYQYNPWQTWASMALGGTMELGDDGRFVVGYGVKYGARPVLLVKPVAGPACWRKRPWPKAQQRRPPGDPAKPTVNKRAEVKAYLADHPEANNEEIREAMAKKGIAITFYYAAQIKSWVKAQQRGRRRTTARPPGSHTGNTEPRLGAAIRPPCPLHQGSCESIGMCL